MCFYASCSEGGMEWDAADRHQSARFENKYQSMICNRGHGIDEIDLGSLWKCQKID